jgi:hypothetical protein
MDTASTAGADGFMAGLRRCGLDPSQQDGVITFAVEACQGALAGQQVRTGVNVNELGAWPAVPPHWLHFPVEVTLPRTNIDPNETLPGWRRHSRQIVGWGDAAEPAQAWMAHVRSVLAEAN